jgi:hypothetical protein
MQNQPTGRQDVEVRVNKPRLCIPLTLIVDDPAPCINPLYYYRLQVDGKNYERHVQTIPFDFLRHFIEVCERHAVRGKWSILPYPAGLGSILQGWDGCPLEEIRRWLDLVRSGLEPNFDITPEILTHTRALDLASGALVGESEQAWMAEQDLAGLTAYMSAATRLLREAGFISAGITQPVSFSGSRADYARATLEAVRSVGGPPVTFFFIDEYTDGPPFREPEVVLLDRERGEAVVDIGNTCPEFCWFTQQPEGRQADETADRFITADGASGRLVDLIANDAWLILVCHWQSLYSDGTRAGLLALDEAWTRLARHQGSRLHWMKTSDIARYQAASATCDIAVQVVEGGIELRLDAAFACPDFTFTVCVPDENWICREVSFEDEQGRSIALTPMPDDAALLAPQSWRRVPDGIAICLELQSGRQRLRLA